MEKRTQRLLAVLALVAPLAVLAVFDVPYVTALSRFTLAGTGFAFLLWVLWRAYQAFLWKVGRRLAFSYFLLGVLPIPMLMLLTGVLAYLLSGFFLGHLYRDAVQSLEIELASMARSRAATFARSGAPRPEEDTSVVFGYYRNGKRLAGDPRTPAAWPTWLEESPAEPRRRQGREEMTRFVRRDDGSPTLAALASRGDAGVVALYVGDLDLELSRRGDLWVETYRSDDPDLKVISLEISGRRIPLLHVRRDEQAEAGKFFKRLSKGERFWDDPVLWWGEISGPLYDPATGKVIADYLAANLNGTPRTVLRHLFSSAAEIDAFAWVTLIVVSSLLFWVYIAAAFMAVFMIVGLSRAVNRLSAATEAVRRGDFSVRIPVRRRDQVGDLQRSFNEMSGNLETLVATAAQKELLEKELALARNLQKSLLPSDLPASEGVEFATLFEPSAAIGGDYFDILRLGDDQLAVVIADVSGHGLSSGLRMAMLKAALLILVEETVKPEEILRRLDTVVRTKGETRVFVTATLALLDLRTGALRLTNAGHPPTYRLRGGQVEEIVLPGSPLGGLGHTYGRTTLDLATGDVVVWLSDGLIEAVNGADEPFGYERVVEALGGLEGQGATEVRNRLLDAVCRYTGGEPPGDDRTLVVMKYLGGKWGEGSYISSVSPSVE
ncbi:MAG TPA: SpoIIE family protein phosphatase [Thermoanaerobaculia bacterium]|nr:SpoIIE family protein phosphatase [Thermoanaerobaculia bacterium]